MKYYSPRGCRHSHYTGAYKDTMPRTGTLRPTIRDAKLQVVREQVGHGRNLLEESRAFAAHMNGGTGDGVGILDISLNVGPRVHKRQPSGVTVAALPWFQESVEDFPSRHSRGTYSQSVACNTEPWLTVEPGECIASRTRCKI